MRTRLVPGAKATADDRRIPKPPREGVDPDRPLAFAVKERASLAKGAPSENAPLTLSTTEVAAMQKEAAELDRLAAEIAARQTELAKATASAKSAPSAPPVPTVRLDTDSEEEYDWSVVLDV